ncbi:hypothetical protein [Priestia filamentosa]|uniref:hypothetical protein n=1 Tax=Priestia filamentosa TaxID=1402861 RepID=UPI0039821482
MKNSFTLDLQTYKGVSEGLKWFLGSKYKDFEKLLLKYMFDEEEPQEELTLQYIEETLEVDWCSVDLNNLWIKIYHFTTRANKEEAFVEIQNLFYLLSNETKFRDFFRYHGIEFELNKSLLKVNGEIYNLLEIKNSANNALEWIHTKLYTDSEVWGFVRVLDITEYNSDFPERPEFVSHVADLLKDDGVLIDDWNRQYGKPYVIEFKQPFYSVQISSNFILSKNDFMRENYLDEEEFELMRNQYDLEKKKGLFRLLVTIFMDNVSRDALSESASNRDEEVRRLLRNSSIKRLYGGFAEMICAVVSKNINIPHNEILKVWEFEEFQKNAMKDNGYL